MKYLILTVMLLASCNVNSVSVPSFLTVIYIDNIQCVVHRQAERGGLSCNWDKYNKEIK